ncbi:MAG: DNA-binding protein [Fimbriiglobus sp.]|nr:DNA-binding protein [Fimbriiglobus sp.]
MRTFVFRLTPGQDLKRELIAFAERHSLVAPVVITCVGSLQRLCVRFAGVAEAVVRTGRFEIVSLVGCIDPPRGHLHIAVADATGAMIGGHLMDGCEVYTTAEVVIGELPGVRFRRELDETYGYRELVVEPHDW